MVSKQLFAYVDARLKQIKGNNRPFGGMSVLAVGDFYQLPPVRQSKPLCVHDPSEIDLWQEHFQMITLTEIMRQKDDVAFAEMLNRIRVKEKDEELSESDRELLTQAITKPELCSTDVLHIFPTNKLVEDHNSATLSRLFSDIITIDADDFQKDSRSERMTRQDKPSKGGRNDLPDTLKLAEGARVMLTRNIDIQKGLVNGAFGTLMKVITSETNQRITKLGLRMDSQTAGRRSGPAGSDDLVYVERAEDTVKQKGVVRRQFPVKLAFSCTVHKTQGLTTHAAVVSLKKIFEAGMAYVALSRVTSLSGLYLLDLDEKKIYANPEVTAAIQTMRQASVDDMMPLLPLRETVSRPDTLTVVHHNTEGLPSHIDDIKRHHELCLADVLCLTESHLQGSFVADTLQLDGFTLYKRNRHVSYTNLPQMASRCGGGVAVYVRNHIQVHEKQYLHNVTDLEFVVLKVEAPVQALIAAVYRPPSYSLRRFLENMPQQILHSGVMRTYWSYHNPVFCIVSTSEP
ncbi:ATP-dependent DNA helicase PIF1-like isoform X2 [Melanotaenia boesemani]|uniref:ATP-dependent DNA helicase PIF1-like isoform X2 n=2 Tax=Melanotaenia boesemani TaxID=1250792 RepID=UPI001C05A2EA|nr:ATP-dependent DNA helicase PIF1-like isoform X2 [Melanotaenia boesemani]